MINRVEITDDMIAEAKRVAELRKIRYGHNTNAISVDRDIVGDLAEQALEKVLDEFNFLYTSTRLKDTGGGDDYDFEVMNEGVVKTIDVKGSTFTYDWENRDENEVHVWDNQIGNILKTDLLCFARVWVKSRVIYILGVIPSSRFKINMLPVGEGNLKRWVCKTKLLWDIRYELSKQRL